MDALSVHIPRMSPPANAGEITDANSIPGSGRSLGEGNGNPLQYSCLENLMDRGAWWATVRRTQRVVVTGATYRMKRRMCLIASISLGAGVAHGDGIQCLDKDLAFCCCTVYVCSLSAGGQSPLWPIFPPLSLRSFTQESWDFTKEEERVESRS